MAAWHFLSVFVFDLPQDFYKKSLKLENPVGIYTSRDIFVRGVFFVDLKHLAVNGLYGSNYREM